MLNLGLAASYKIQSEQNFASAGLCEGADLLQHLALHFGQRVVAIPMEGVGLPIKGGYVGALLHCARGRSLETLTVPSTLGASTSGVVLQTQTNTIMVHFDSKASYPNRTRSVLTYHSFVSCR